MSEQAKDTLETVAAAGVAIVVAGAAGAGLAAAIPGLIGLAYMKFQEHRVRKWWQLVVDRSIDADELSARVSVGLATEDAYVIAGVVGGARAACAAIELAAVPVVAELTRRYFQEHDLPLWFYRGVLEVLERIEAIELAALRGLFREITAIRSDSVTVLGDLEGGRGWRVFQTSVTEQWQQLTPFANASRLFGYLKRAGLGFDSGGYGIGGSPKVLVIERNTADWIHGALSAC